jgi:hypothetical protein
VINKDTVVVLPIKEAKGINTKFIELRDSISLLKSDKDSISKDFTKYQILSYNSLNLVKTELDSVKFKFDWNKKMIETERAILKKDINMLRTVLFAPYVLLLLLNILNLQ